MSDSERFALAARLYSAIKRSSGRVIDVLWLLQDEAYSREIIRVAAAGDGECAELALRLEAMLRGETLKSAPAAQTAAGALTASGTHYVRGLR